MWQRDVVKDDYGKTCTAEFDATAVEQRDVVKDAYGKTRTDEFDAKVSEQELLADFARQMKEFQEQVSASTARHAAEMQDKLDNLTEHAKVKPK